SFAGAIGIRQQPWSGEHPRCYFGRQRSGITFRPGRGKPKQETARGRLVRRGNRDRGTIIPDDLFGNVRSGAGRKFGGLDRVALLDEQHAGAEFDGPRHLAGLPSAAAFYDAVTVPRPTRLSGPLTKYFNYVESERVKPDLAL